MTALHIANPDDLDRLLPMVMACHAHHGVSQNEEECRVALEPLLEGVPHGVAYLIGPRRSPVGFLVVSFGWSVARGGIEGRIDTFWIREAIRGRGMGTEVLFGLLPALGQHGVRALHVQIGRDNTRGQKLFGKAGFVADDADARMVRVF